MNDDNDETRRMAGRNDDSLVPEDDHFDHVSIDDCDIDDDAKKQRTDSDLPSLPDYESTPKAEHEDQAGEQARAEAGAQIQQAKTDDKPWSTYSTRQKKMLILTASWVGFFSPLSSSAYLPALDTIAADLNVSTSKVNLTVTVFLIIQGIAPMMVAGFADTAGRRPAYLYCFIVYLAANLGLALQNSYGALMGLRCLQSAGISGTIALANGVVSDLITSQERGSYIAYASLGSTLGPTLSPIIGGLLTQDLDWHWIFWFLLIVSGATAVPFFLFFPETSRKIVDNQSKFPPQWYNRCLADAIRKKHMIAKGTYVEEEHDEDAEKRRSRIRVPNPFATLVVFKDLMTAMVLIPAGLTFGSFYAVLTGVSSQMTTIYGFNDIETALMYIPLGVGGLLSAVTTGKLVDWNFRRHAKRLGMPVVKNRKGDLTNFPVERARLEVNLPMFVLGSLAMIIYGWIMEYKVNLAGPVIMLFVLGWALAACFQVLNILLVDIYPGKGATVTAAVNLVRCEIGAAAAAVISPLENAIGTGWAYTIFAFISFGSLPFLMITMTHGMKWRQKAKAKEEEKKRVAEAKAAAEKNDGIPLQESPRHSNPTTSTMPNTPPQDEEVLPAPGVTKPDAAETR